MSGFLRAEKGNTAMIFGLTSIAVIMAAGAGIDVSRAMVVRTRMAEALDAAALAIGTTNGLTQAQLTSLAQQYFDANYPAGTMGSIGGVEVSASGQTMSLSVSGSVPTTLLKIAHIYSLPLSVRNQVVRAVTKLRVSLVLDVTGSMSQTDASGTSKISALRTATHQLLSQLQGAAINPGDVQVAIIPFSKDVNIGTANVNATWLDWSDWDSPPPNSLPPSNVGTLNAAPLTNACPYGTNVSPYGYRCTSGPANGAASVTTIPASGLICPGLDNGNYNTGHRDHYYNGCYDSVPITTTTHPAPTTTTVCTNSNSCTTATYCTGYPQTTSSTSGASTTTTVTTCECHTTSGTRKTCTRTATPTVVTTTGFTHTWQKNSHNTWNGCVWDRTQSNDVLNTTPTTGGTLFMPENYAYCPPVSVMAMGYDWTALNNKVDQLAPNGATNQTIGLAWGWQAQTQGVPLNAPPTDPLAINVVILLSDGLNTQNRWAGDGVNQSAAVDSRMTQLCTNMKAQNYRIYTVLVMSGNSSVLQNCASDASKYFELGTAEEIITTFNTIGTELANLHLSL